MDKWRADSEQAEVEGPEVLEGGPDVPKRISADNGTVGQASPIEGDHQATNGSGELFVVFAGEKEEEHVVRKDGDDEGVDVKDAIGEGKGTHTVAVGRKTLKRLLERLGKNVAERDVAADGDAKVNSVRLERQIGPRTRAQRLDNTGVQRTGPRKRQTARLKDRTAET